jgi:hypothetical protein
VPDHAIDLRGDRERGRDDERHLMREAIKGVLKYQRPSEDREAERHLMREAIKGVLKYQRPSEDREDERHLEAPERVREHSRVQSRW